MNKAMELSTRLLLYQLSATKTTESLPTDSKEASYETSYEVPLTRKIGLKSCVTFEEFPFSCHFNFADVSLENVFSLAVVRLGFYLSCVLA